jgi:hypothetical protein
LDLALFPTVCLLGIRYKVVDPSFRKLRRGGGPLLSSDMSSPSLDIGRSFVQCSSFGCLLDL